MPRRFLCNKNCSRSSRYSDSRIGDMFSPCRTPQSQAKNGEFSLLTETLDLIPWYILCIMRNILPSTELCNSFCQRPTRQTVSKALEKLMKVQYNFFLQDLNSSVKTLRVNIWSVVEYPLRKPAWFSLNAWWLSWNLEVKSFPRQLRTVIGR